MIYLNENVEWHNMLIHYKNADFNEWKVYCFGDVVKNYVFQVYNSIYLINNNNLPISNMFALNCSFYLHF